MCVYIYIHIHRYVYAVIKQQKKTTKSVSSPKLAATERREDPRHLENVVPDNT